MAPALNPVAALALAAVLLTTLPKPSTSQIIHGLTVGGRLCCTSTGNCPLLGNGTGVRAAPVHLDCKAANGDCYEQVATSLTMKSGYFNITVPNSISYSFEDPTIPCMVRVDLPLSRGSNCSAISANSNDTLISGLKPNGVGTTLLLGLVRNATITGFVRKLEDQ